MYIISGCNIHGQWMAPNPVLLFQDLGTKSKNGERHFDQNRAQLLALKWSYNIFQFDETFYISGNWRGYDNVLVKVELPDEIVASEKKFKLTLCGNDHKLYLIDCKTFHLWELLFVDEIEWNWIYKKINLNVELPLSEEVKKKPKLNNYVKKVVSTNSAVCILTTDGDLYELPNKINTSHCVGKVIDVEYGYDFRMILTDVGRVYTWGNGMRCQLGHGDLTNLDEPTEVEALAGIKITKISAGGWHSLALSEFGDVYVWGLNDNGQLGIDNEILEKSEGQSKIPRVIDLFDEKGKILEDVNIKDIACGSKHSAILLEDNSVWTTGTNRFGQLGFSTREVPVLYNFKKSYECVTDGELFCGTWCTVIKTKYKGTSTLSRESTE